jgi:hypothetical protein
MKITALILSLALSASASRTISRFPSQEERNLKREVNDQASAEVDKPKDGRERVAAQGPPWGAGPPPGKGPPWGAGPPPGKGPPWGAGPPPWVKEGKEQ